MPIVINPSVSQAAAPSATAAVVLQPGSVITAKVLQVLGNDTVQIAIAGQPIDVLSQVPLQAGQTLQLAVSQGSDGSIRLAVVSPQDGASASQGVSDASAAFDSVTLAPGATASIAAQTPVVVAARIQLTPLEALAVSVAAQTAATQQTSLAPLFANLGVAAGLNGLPPQVQQAAALVLSQRTSLDPNLTGDDIKQAFQNSGLFLEASLASGSASVSGATPDLKAALIVLRQVLTTSLDGVTATPSAPATPGTPAIPNALTTPNAQATQPGPASTVAVPQGPTPPAAGIVQGTPQPGVTAPALVVPQGATPAAQPGTASAAIVPGQGTQPSQASPQPITITVVPQQTPVTASPALASLLASEIATPQMQGAAAPVAPDAPVFSAVSQILSPASTPADAAARTAVSSAALNLLQEALQAGPLAAANLSRFVLDDGAMLSLLPAVAGARIASADDGDIARTNVPPPPLRGALPAAQPVMPATLFSNSRLETAMHQLLADTDGAIARQTLLQVASLPGQTDMTAGRLDPAAPRWNFEIPFATPQGTAMAQFEISRDGGGNEVEAAKRVWRARFSLDVEPAGPVHAQVTLSGERTSVRMWAQRPATAAQLRAGAAQLSQALSKAELGASDIVIRDGTPAQTASAPAGHFLDRAL
jgi:Flagellar hook-length control protein FliK